MTRYFWLGILFSSFLFAQTQVELSKQAKGVLAPGKGGTGLSSCPEGEGLTFWEALRRAEQAPGLATRSLTQIRGFVDMVEELQSMVDAGERPDVVLESGLARSGHRTEIMPSRLETMVPTTSCVPGRSRAGSQMWVTRAPGRK